MARPMGEEKKRAETVKSLENALENNKMTEKFLRDKIEEYMSFYDDLRYLNEQLIAMKHSGNLKAYMGAVSEKRRISNEMRNILVFLGLKPTDAQLASDGEPDEEL